MDDNTLDAAATAAERRMIMPKNVVCKKCNNLVNDWCEKVIDSPDPDMQRDCQHFCEKTNADRIRSMSDEELAEFLTHINPTNCQDCAFSHGWRCQPDRDDYSDFKKCEEGRKRWIKQPAEGE